MGAATTGVANPAGGAPAGVAQPGGVYTRRAMAFASLLSIALTQEFKTGDRLLRQGEPSRGAFVLPSGRAAAQGALPRGGMLTVAEFGEGDVFGEMALIERGVCSATVSALTEVKASFVEREDFRALVASRDAAALGVQRALT